MKVNLIIPIILFVLLVLSRMITEIPNFTATIALVMFTGYLIQNKFLSVVYTGEMIKGDDDKFIKLFEESKKKDDLADAYLQGIYWIEK